MSRQVSDNKKIELSYSENSKNKYEISIKY